MTCSMTHEVSPTYRREKRKGAHCPWQCTGNTEMFASSVSNLYFHNLYFHFWLLSSLVIFTASVAEGFFGICSATGFLVPGTLFNEEKFKPINME